MLHRLLIAACAALVACDDHDIGKACPQLEATPSASGDGTRVETQEIVAVSPLFPCDELVCIATDGRAGYCSKKCRADVSCPDGFECRSVQPLGEFANDKFCAWKPCQRRSDCGNPEGFCCLPAPNQLPGEDAKLCAFSNDGKCP